jgi:hypothetical protein
MLIRSGPKCQKLLLIVSRFRAQIHLNPFVAIVVDWAGFEPATFRLRIERSYQTELPALMWGCVKRITHSLLYIALQLTFTCSSPPFPVAETEAISDEKDLEIIQIGFLYLRS